MRVQVGEKILAGEVAADPAAGGDEHPLAQPPGARARPRAGHGPARTDLERAKQPDLHRGFHPPIVPRGNTAGTPVFYRYDMNMSIGYQIYQAERSKSYPEQLQADYQAGQRAAASTRRWHAIVRPLLVRKQVHSLDLQQVCHQAAGQ
jgi:hypothetical protein